MGLNARQIICVFLLIGLARPGMRAQAEPAGVTATKESPRESSNAQHPRFEVRKAERLKMVREQIEKRGVRDPKVLEAMRQVPRHLFVPENLNSDAYDDTPLPIGYGQTISQPYIVAFMTEIVHIKPTDKVLEIGTGSGYQAAVASELTDRLFTIEIVEKLGIEARQRLEKLGYKTVNTFIGDGYFGLKEQAPFDVIIVTAAATHVPAPLLKQLKPGGRMIIPVGSYGTQELIIVTRDDQGGVRTRSVLPVRFVPLTGGKTPSKSDSGTGP